MNAVASAFVMPAQAVAAMPTTADLTTAFARIPPSAEAAAGQLALGTAPAGAVTLTELAAGGAALDLAMANMVQHVAGPDAKLACAYLLGDISWMLGCLASGLWLGGYPIASLSPEAVALSFRFVEWEYDGEVGRYCTIDLTLDAEGATCGAAEALALGRAIATLHQPLIDALAKATGLAAAAQWRIVGDGLSGGLLHQGKAMGQAAFGMQTAKTILTSRETRLYSRQTDFVQITFPADAAPETALACDWFRLRGGCCRYYTTEGGEYCTTCVLRDRPDQITRLRDYLQSTIAAA